MNRPDGPYAVEMTAGAAWPSADEDTYRRRSEELTDTHTQVSGAREQWERHRNAVFGGDGVWSGRAAGAAVSEIDSRTTAMGTLQQQLRTAADQAGAAASAITDAKTQVADNVRTAQQVIAQAETLDVDGIDALINQVVVTTYAANTEVVTTAAARLAGPGTPKEHLGDNRMKAFGPIRKAPVDVNDDPGGPPKKLPDEPTEFRKFWESLTPEERNELYEQDHRIGNHPGMPFGGDAANPGRDFFNRKYLAELQQSKQAHVNQLQSRFDDLTRKVYMGDKTTATGQELQQASTALRDARHSLDGYSSVQQTLDKKDGVKRYLGVIDDQGHAAVSINNPDNAARSAIFVPGTGQDMAAFTGSDDKSFRMYKAALHADPSLKADDVAVTTWMGYDRPMDLIQASSLDQAVNGGPALDTFLDGMHASHSGPPAIDTVIGHSYGSTLVGGAATDGHHLAADNVIAVGSPGMVAATAGDLNLDPGAHVYSVTAQHDVIHLATGATLGPDPFTPSFGATRLDASTGPSWGPGLPSVGAHSSYWDPGNPALQNMGDIIAGKAPHYIAPAPEPPLR